MRSNKLYVTLNDVFGIFFILDKKTLNKFINGIIFHPVRKKSDILGLLEA